MILPDTAREAAVVWAEALREAVARADAGDLAPGLPLSISLGVAVDHGAGRDALYAAADRQLYAAKRGGRNRVCG